MVKRALVIINPNSGLKKANRFLTEIIEKLNKAEYICSVFTTTILKNAEYIAGKYAYENDIVVCIGGDGTFNEVLSGLIQNKINIPIGYIPSGSTNDFAYGLGLSKNILTATDDIICGKTVSVDAGKFNDRFFSYVASCGAFSDTSFSTPTDLKNLLGHTAYVLEGIKSIPTIKPVHLKISANGEMIEDDYIFAAVCNSTSIGGILKFNKSLIDVNDGLFEIMLIKSPMNMGDLTKIIHYINVRNYENEMINIIKTNKATIESEKPLDWSLDGEAAKNQTKIDILVLKNAFSICVNNGG